MPTVKSTDAVKPKQYSPSLPQPRKLTPQYVCYRVNLTCIIASGLVRIIEEFALVDLTRKARDHSVSSVEHVESVPF